VSDVPVWTCDFEAPEHLTVGHHFRLRCHGDIAVDWSADLPVIKPAKAEDEFALVILSAEQLKPQAVQLTVTGYRPGDHAPEYVRVMQGSRGFETEKPKWKIESVIAQDSAPPKPYPSVGPFSVFGPPWLALTLYLVLILAAVLLGRAIYRWIKRRAFRRELEAQRTALSPVRQFYRDARALRRRLNQATDSDELRRVGVDLDRQFRLFLMREFEVPALTSSDAGLVKELRRHHRPVMDVAGDDLRKTLRELSRAQARPATLAADVDQLLRMCVDVTEMIERGRK